MLSEELEILSDSDEDLALLDAPPAAAQHGAAQHGGGEPGHAENHPILLDLDEAAAAAAGSSGLYAPPLVAQTGAGTSANSSGPVNVPAG